MLALNIDGLLSSFSRSGKRRSAFLISFLLCLGQNYEKNYGQNWRSNANLSIATERPEKCLLLLFRKQIENSLCVSEGSLWFLEQWWKKQSQFRVLPVLTAEIEKQQMNAGHEQECSSLFYHKKHPLGIPLQELHCWKRWGNCFQMSVLTLSHECGMIKVRCSSNLIQRSKL